MSQTVISKHKPQNSEHENVSAGALSKPTKTAGSGVAVIDNVRASEQSTDVIIVGSGTGASTMARELTQQGLKVLILEQGAYSPLQDSFLGILKIAKEYKIGSDLKSTTAITAGGSTAIYLGVYKPPEQTDKDSYGIDLHQEMQETEAELPIGKLPESFTTPQSIAFRQAAESLGYVVKNNSMLINETLCDSGNYSYQAKWKSRDFLDQAVAAGAELKTKAQVTKVIVQDGVAIGVEYKEPRKFGRGEKKQVFAKKIVLAGGAFGTPKLLLDCGLNEIKNNGFFCKPGYMVCGSIPSMNGTEGFLGNYDIDLGNGVSVGDGTMHKALFKLVMLSNGKFRQMFSHRKILAAGILLSDETGGVIDSNGNYSKRLSESDQKKLADAEQVARGILSNAGAVNLFTTKTVAGLPGGLLKVGRDLDENLQTRIPNLHVCDHCVIADVGSTPTVTLICLAKYLSKALSSRNQAQQFARQAQPAREPELEMAE